MNDVLSIEFLGEITPIVEAQSHCPGIARSRGNMIELMDSRALFGLGNYVSAKFNRQIAKRKKIYGPLLIIKPESLSTL